MPAGTKQLFKHYHLLAACRRMGINKLAAHNDIPGAGTHNDLFLNAVSHMNCAAAAETDLESH